MSISVNIHAGTNVQNSNVSAEGYMFHVITDPERRTFHIGTDAELKHAVGRYFSNDRSPNDAFVRSPTPWNDLFKTYNWQQTETLLTVRSATVTEISSEPSIITSQRFVNKSSVVGTFEVGISQEVANTTESNWNNSNTVNFEQSVRYGISFLGTDGGGATCWSYERTWGVGGSQSQTITVGSSSKVSVVLQPGEAVRSILRATRGFLRVRIVYGANLRGRCALNYYPKYNGHHFWGVDIALVVNGPDSSNDVQIVEDIRIGYYSDAEIILEDDR